MQSVGLSPYGMCPNAPDDPSTHALMDHKYNYLSFFNSEFKFLLMHESNFYVTGLSYGSNTRDAMGRVSRSQTAFDVAATATYS
jgi:hypothetical protein